MARALSHYTASPSPLLISKAAPTSRLEWISSQGFLGFLNRQVRGRRLSGTGVGWIGSRDFLAFLNHQVRGRRLWGTGVGWNDSWESHWELLGFRNDLQVVRIGGGWGRLNVNLWV